MNSLFLTLLLSAFSLLVIWPASTSLTPTLIFAIVNGVSNGGWFSAMPMVVGNTFGSLRVGTAMGMIVSGWSIGYFLVRSFDLRSHSLTNLNKGAPIAGFILQAAGGQNTLTAFRPAILWAGSMALGSAGLVGFIRLRTNSRIFVKV
jgi:hypothetical protein